MREGFHEIADGWMLITGTDDLDDRIDRLAEWINANGPQNSTKKRRSNS